MPNNIYDDAVDQLPPALTPQPSTPQPAKENPYAAVVDSFDAGQAQQLRTSLVQADSIAPDRAAEVRKLSDRTGIAADIVDRNFDSIRQRSKLVDTPYNAMLRETPALATWASEPTNAAVSHDDMDKLGALEWLVSMPSRAISQSLNEQGYGELRTKSLFQPLTQAEQDQLSSYKYHATLGGEFGAGNSWFRGALTKTMKLLTTLSGPESIPTAIGATGGAIIGGAGGFLMAGVGAIPGAVAGAKLGAEAGYAYGLGKSAFQTAAASSYDEYLDLRDATGRKLDPDVAKAAALVNGAVNAGLMTFGGKAIAAGMEAGGARIGTLLTKNTIKSALKQPSVVSAIAEMMKTYGTTLTEGTALMVAMKASDIIAGSIANASGSREAITGQLEPGNIDLFKQPAVKNADGSISTVDSFSINQEGKEILLPSVMPDGRHLDQPAAIAEYQKTGRHLGTFDSPASADAFAQQLHEDYAKGKYTPPSVGQQLLNAAGEGLQSFSIIGLAGPAMGLAREVQRARRASQGEAFFQALGEGVAQSKTAQRLPEGAQAFLEQATKGGPVEHVYAPLDGWSKYWQDAGVDPASMAAEVTGRPDAFAQAETTGLLEIPTARYATKLAGTEHNAALSRILKLDPDAMNADEAAQLVADIQGGKHDQTAEPPAESPVRQAVLQQLEKAGVTGTAAEGYADVYDAAFGSMAQRAGVDPAELFAGYGLQVDRPDLAAAWDQTPAPAGEAARPGATDVAVSGQGGPVVQSDYTGPERRSADVLAAAGELRRRASDEPIPALAHALNDEAGHRADIRTRAEQMRRENPNVDKEAVAMREKAAKAGRIKEPADAAALRSGTQPLVDRKSDAAQNPGDYLNAERPSDTRAATAPQEGAGSPDAQGQQPRADEGGAVQRGGDGERAQPGGAPAGIPAYGETFQRQDAAATAARVTPNVRRELTRIADELERDQYEGATWSWLESGEKKTGNAAGGEANKRAGHGGAAVYVDILSHSPVNKVTSGRAKGEAAERAHGSRAKVLEAVKAAIAGEPIANNLIEGAIRVAENRDAGLYRDLSRPALPPAWGSPVDARFTDALSTAIDEADKPGDMLKASGLEQDAVDTGGDTSFDITEFSQGLFDDLQDPDPKVDTLTDTGEQQPRLPGDVGNVRDEEKAAPEFALPFSLTSEVAKPKKGGQTALFQSTPITREGVEAFSADVKRRLGADLQGFELSVNQHGDIFLESLVVDRGAQRAGLGSQAMQELTRYADLKGVRVALTPAHPGDIGPGEPTSYGRLVKLYKRFGFVENKGRHSDQALTAGMYREPNVIMGQPLFHGSPHDFERFSLAHVGTGEGAAAYGHGLYFAENPAVAANYHDQLSEGRDVVSMKLGKMTLRAPEFNYTDKAHVNDVENIRASIAEDLLAGPLDLNAAGEAGFRDHVLAMVDQRIADYEKEYPEGVAAAEKLRAELEKPGALSVEFTKTTGGVYQVDIPDEHLERMLDWDKGLEEQPANVREALAKIDPDLWTPGGADYDPRETGASIYHRLTDLVQRDKIPSQMGRGGDSFGKAAEGASHLLASEGVPGLRYLDQGSRDQGDGTRNVVAFDESIVTLTHKDGKPFTPAERKEYFQGDADVQPVQQQPRRGAIRFGEDRQFSIDLLERADLSTFLHESGHFFLEVFGDIADKVSAIAPDQLTEAQRHLLSDYGVTLQALGVENRSEISTPQHEQFARLFEAYLMEGKAPSAELRTTFARFRAWLVGIYQSLSKLNVKLTPDVRSVMDRLLASDQAIADAEAQRGVEAMFTTAESAGMDPTEFALYGRTIADASKDAREQLDRRLLSEVHREQTAEWKARRAEIRTAVENDVQQRPEYRALAAMKKGTHPNGEPLVEGLETPPLVLSRAILEERFGKDRIKRLPRGIVGADGGLDPDVLAGMFGYASADAMLTAVEKAPAMRDVIEQQTKRRMIEEHGSILLDGTLTERAQAATANETRDEVIRAEMRALGRKRREVAPFVKAEQRKGAAALADAAKERAYERRWFEAEARLRIAIAEGHKQVEIDALTKTVQELRAHARGGAAVIRAAIPDAAVLRDAAAARVASMTIGEIRPALYWTASRRAGQQALERAARQDFDGAITAKQQELVNLNLYRQAEKALEDVDDRVRFAKSLSTPAARKGFGLAGGSYLDQVDGILDRFEFSKVPQKVLDRRGSLRKFVESLEGQGLPVDIPEELLDESKRRNYKQLTVEELKGVTDGLKELQHLAQLKNRLLRRAEKRELDTVAGAIATSVRDHFTGTPPVAERDRRVSTERSRMVGDFFAGHMKMATLARIMDGDVDGGPMWEALIRPLNDAGDREADMTAKATKALGDIIEEAYPRSQKRLLYEKMDVPEVGQSLSKMERLAIALNWGNEGNRDRIRTGEKWKDDQVQAILDTLDARDLKFVQAVLDHINSYWPEIAAKQERVYGVAPEKVEATPIKAKAGEIAGGYYPLMYDDRADPKAAAHLDYEGANLGKAAAYAQATTKRGHTKERVSNVKMPLRRDFGVIFQHVNQVIHDLSHHEALIDVGRVLAHPDVQKAIYGTHGDLVYRQFKNGIRDVAFGQTPAQNSFERALNSVRAGATVAGLGWSLSTALLHLSSALPRAVVRIGPKYVARGVARWTRDALSMENTAHWIDEQSMMMRNRSRTQQREINELRNAVGVNTGKFSGWIAEIIDKTSLGLVGKQGLVDSYFYLVQQAQRIADIPTWLGQYEKSMAGGHNETDAIAHADQAVLDAFGGGQNKDLASVQRGGALLKLWTNFYSPFNVTYNLTVSANRRFAGRFSEPGAIGRLAVDYLMLYTVPATLGLVIHGALKANKKDDTANESASTIAGELLRAHMAYAADTMLGTRELSGVIQGYRGYEGPAGARLFSSVGRLISAGEHSAGKVQAGHPEEALDRNFWLSLNDAGGVIFHYPAGQVGRTIDGIAALAEGKTSNPGALIVGAPKK